jgi:DNA-binding transcriptional LysR family regulator
LKTPGGLRSHPELGSTAAILAAARRAEGPAVLSALAVADDLDTGRLVGVPTEGIKLTRSLWAVWPPDRPLPPPAGNLLSIASS